MGSQLQSHVAVSWLEIPVFLLSLPMETLDILTASLVSFLVCFKRTCESRKVLYISLGPWFPRMSAVVNIPTGCPLLKVGQPERSVNLRDYTLHSVKHFSCGASQEEQQRQKQNNMTLGSDGYSKK